MGILAWLILGLIAGFVASKLMGGGGYGIVGDIIVGIIGALLGGLAIVGAMILIAILRAVSGNRARV